MADSSKSKAASKAFNTKSVPSVTASMCEYFELKDQDKAIRAVRNEFMANEENACTNPDFTEEGPCIYQTRGMGGYPVDLCPSCTKRQAWYEQRQVLSRKRAQIIRRVKRQVRGTDLLTDSSKPASGTKEAQSNET